MRSFEMLRILVCESKEKCGRINYRDYVSKNGGVANAR